jgi:hypothetical protein
MKTSSKAASGFVGPAYVHALFRDRKELMGKHQQKSHLGIQDGFEVIEELG